MSVTAPGLALAERVGRVLGDLEELRALAERAGLAQPGCRPHHLVVERRQADLGRPRHPAACLAARPARRGRARRVRGVRRARQAAVARVVRGHDLGEAAGRILLRVGAHEAHEGRCIARLPAMPCRSAASPSARRGSATTPRRPEPRGSSWLGRASGRKPASSASDGSRRWVRNLLIAVRDRFCARFTSPKSTRGAPNSPRTDHRQGTAAGPQGSICRPGHGWGRLQRSRRWWSARRVRVFDRPERRPESLAAISVWAEPGLVRERDDVGALGRDRARRRPRRWSSRACSRTGRPGTCSAVLRRRRARPRSSATPPATARPSRPGRTTRTSRPAGGAHRRARWSDRPVARDRHEPRGQRAARGIVALGADPQGEERLLDHLPRRPAIAARVQRRREDRAAVAVVEDGKRVGGDPRSSRGKRGSHRDLTSMASSAVGSASESSPGSADRIAPEPLCSK